MHLGWWSQLRLERLPLLVFQLEDLLVEEGFGRAGQTTLQHEVGHVVLPSHCHP